MGLKLTYSVGQTPLEEAQMEGLKIRIINTQQQLNEFEQTNINEALKWVNAKRKIEDLLTESFMKDLHKRMFGLVWKWAGTYRNIVTNIGSPWRKIPVELRTLIDDCNYWIEHKTFPEEEIVIRFKHKLVSIHCFPNGNGRHSRLMADLIAVHIFGLPKFTWGGRRLVESSEQRKRYLKALQQADNGEYKALIKFAKS
jgi:Fic-DOC domain mobile mystery protein B